MRVPSRAVAVIVEILSADACVIIVAEDLTSHVSCVSHVSHVAYAHTLPYFFCYMVTP